MLAKEQELLDRAGIKIAAQEAAQAKDFVEETP
jgi:hypothetical protein